MHWFKYFNQLGNDCLHPTLVYAGDVRRVEMMHMHGNFVVLGVGVTASVIAIILELLYWKGIRPYLPQSFRTSNVSVMDYYNKIFIGYGYSNHRVMSPVKSKPAGAGATRTSSSLLSFGRNSGNVINNNNDKTGTSTPRESLGSANSRTGLYDNRQQNNNYINNAKNNYNTTKNYINSYSNYAATQKSEFRSKFGL